MLSGYAKLGMLKPARKLFDKMPQKDVVSWNTMVIGCYKELRRDGIGCNEYTFSGLMMVLGAGFLSNVVVSCSVLDAYAKCSGMKFASRLFDEMRVKDVLSWTTMNPISWTSLIAGYARNGQGHKAFELFTKMMRFRVSPDQFTFSSVLCACASLASLKHGKQVHGHLLRIDFRPNTIVKDAVLWNTMLSALAQHGRGEEAIRMLNEMVSSGVAPNRITLEEGLRVFESMTMVDGHGIVPDDEHYACLIDLLGRGGDFENLANQLRMLPCEPSERIWNSLLGVCSIHGNMEPGSPAAHLLLSSVYGELGRWDLVEKVREVMERRQVRKEQGLSWIEKGSSLQQTSMAAAEEEEEEEAF
ncbi:Pentatricopeptide repeat-containing protein At2g21090 [Linum perenne]